MASWLLSMAFSTGMVCMPMPSPPSGTIGVMGSKGRKVILSKKLATGGLASVAFLVELNNSADPGTKKEMRYLLSWVGLASLIGPSSL